MSRRKGGQRNMKTRTERAGYLEIDKSPGSWRSKNLEIRVDLRHSKRESVDSVTLLGHMCVGQSVNASSSLLICLVGCKPSSSASAIADSTKSSVKGSLLHARGRLFERARLGCKENNT